MTNCDGQILGSYDGYFCGMASSQVLVELMTRFARRLLSSIYYKSKLKAPSYQFLEKSKVQ